MGRCRVVRRAEVGTPAATLISWARSVAVVAVACTIEARLPAARVRLNAIAASTSQAAFAVKFPGGQVRERTVLQVGVDLFDDGVAAVLCFSLQHRVG